MIQFDYDLSTRLKPPTSLHPSFTKTIHLGSAKIHHFRFRRSDRGYQRRWQFAWVAVPCYKMSLGLNDFFTDLGSHGMKIAILHHHFGGTVWWFQRFFLMFIIAWGNDPIWRSYFCRWWLVQPPFGVICLELFPFCIEESPRIQASACLSKSPSWQDWRWVGNFRIFPTPSRVTRWNFRNDLAAS